MEAYDMWFGAHLVTEWEESSSVKGGIVLEESIILICAASFSEAQKKAEKQLKKITKKTKNKRLCRVRRIISLSRDEDMTADSPSDLAEITFELFEFASVERAEMFVESKKIDATFFRPE
jgi:Domain of unknown function (DUF4288)